MTVVEASELFRMKADRLEQEVAALRSEVVELRREREKILKLWTAERARLLTDRRNMVSDELRDLRARDRAVRKVLDLYSTGSPASTSGSGAGLPTGGR